MTRALQLLRSALASCATVETTDDPTVIEIRPGTMAGPAAIVTRIRLQAARPMPAALEPNVTSIPIQIVEQRLHVTGAAIRAGRAHSVVGCIDLAGIVTIRLPGVYIDRTDVKAKPINETQTPSVGTMTDPRADRSSLVGRKLMAADAPDTGWHAREPARVTGLTVSHVAAVLNELVSRGICRREFKGTRKALITDRHALFTAWTEACR